jgi:hypothetical protein
MEAVYPEIKGHIVAEQSWLTLASKIYKKHGNVVLNVYTDEAWVTKALVQYNGKEGAHGFYNFPNIQQQDTPRLSSATALRNAVAADNRDAFGQAAGVDPNTPVAGKPFFDVVKYYLMPHAEKAAAKPVKKKVKQPEQDVAENAQKPRCTKWTYSGQWPNQVATCVTWDSPAGGQAASPAKPTTPTGSKVPGRPAVEEDNDPCWDSHKMVGTKKKGGKQVPNCVPKEHVNNLKKNLAELSSDMLGRYKKAAGDDATKADKAGDFEKGHKRFKGIVKATNKQFDNDIKGKK